MPRTYRRHQIGDTTKHSHGYVLEYEPSHPRAHFGWVYQHILVWERAHGPVPTGWTVHHRNHARADNRLENLTALPSAKHSRLHMPRKRALALAELSKFSERNGRPRSTTPEQDAEMLRMRENGAQLREIAAVVLGDPERYSTVHKIIKRQRHSHSPPR